MSQTPHEDREREIEERAEQIEPGSADQLNQAREAIDDASGAAAEVAAADITDMEFNPSGVGAAGAVDQEIDTDEEEQADLRLVRDQAHGREDGDADEAAAERDEAVVVQQRGMDEPEAAEAGREPTTEGGVGGETGGDIGGRP